MWGPEVHLQAHTSAITYTISYAAVGKTTVIGEVTYAASNGQFVTRQFNGSITFTTGNFVDSPIVKFKGIPFGSAVTVTVTK